MPNVRIIDNGQFMVTVNGLAVVGFYSLGLAWEHIRWMHDVAGQQFTVGKNNTPVEKWIRKMEESCGLEKKVTV